MQVGSILILILVAYIAVRAAQQGCGEVALPTRVGDALSSIITGGGASDLSVREDPASALKKEYKLYGAEWCTFTRKMYAALKGDTWETVKDVYETDPQVVRCDQDVVDPKDKKICESTGYPTIVEVSKIPVNVDEIPSFLEQNDGVVLGFDESKVDALRRSK